MHKQEWQKEVETVTVRIPKPIVLWLDELVRSGLYHSRSEAIRDFARDHLRKQQRFRGISIERRHSDS